MFDDKNAILITDPEQILFFTGVYAEGYLLAIGDKLELFTDPRYIGAVNKDSTLRGLTVKIGGLDEVILDVPKASKIGIDYSVTVTKVAEKLKESFDVFDGSDKINSLLSQKNQSQLDLIKRSCEICETAFLETVECIKLGMTENELAAELEYRFRKYGAEGTSFETIVAFGKNSAVPHHRTSNDKLERDSVVLMDFGCKYQGFCSDMTRTLYVGEPTEKFLKCYSAVETAHKLAYNAINDGMSGKEADLIARDYLDKQSLAKFFTHSLGHGIGTHIHEYPTLSPRSKATLKNGNVFSIEPGVYFDGEFGIRIENTVALIGGKPQSFMKSSLGLKVLDI